MFGDYSGYVNPEAYLVHGCKDGSLARLMAEIPAIQTTATPIVVNSPSTESSAQAPAASTPTEPKPFEPMVPSEPERPARVFEDPDASAFAKALAKAEAAKQANIQIIERIKPLLAAKKYRIGDLSKDANIPVPTIITLSKTPNSGIRISGPARWVTLAT
jgi:hypothetical protein